MRSSCQQKQTLAAKHPSLGGWGWRSGKWKMKNPKVSCGFCRRVDGKPPDSLDLRSKETTGHRRDRRKSSNAESLCYPAMGIFFASDSAWNDGNKHGDDETLSKRHRSRFCICQVLQTWSWSKELPAAPILRRANFSCPIHHAVVAMAQRRRAEVMDHQVSLCQAYWCFARG